jgi:hypothetical protein
MIKTLLTRLKGKPEIYPSTEPLSLLTSQRLERGTSYLIKDEGSDKGLEIFRSLVTGRCIDCTKSEAFSCESIGCEGCTLICPCRDCREVRAQGLCLTIRSPGEIRRKYTLQTTPILWISNYGTENISPSSLELMAEMVIKFLGRSQNPVVFLDGVEYLIVANGFPSVLRFLKDIQDWIILNKAIYLLPINPLALNTREMAILERTMEVL